VVKVGAVLGFNFNGTEDTIRDVLSQREKEDKE
jgi:hypothetical protein